VPGAGSINLRGIKMGCWNGSCIISGLSIDYGTKAVALPIFDGRFALAPIFGVYNDYGSLKDVEENDYTNALVEEISENSAISLNHDEYWASNERTEVIPPKKPWCIGPQVKYSVDNNSYIPKSIYDVLKLMERESVRGNVLSYRSWNGKDEKYKPLTFALANRDVYEKFVYYLADARNDLTDANFNEIASLASALESAYNKDYTSSSQLSTFEFLCNEIISLTSGYQNVSDTDVKLTTFGLTEKIKMKLFEYSEEYSQIISNIDMLIEAKDKKSVAKLLLEYKVFISNMYYFRKTIGLPLGAGSQSTNTEDIIKMNNIINEIAEGIIKKQEEGFG
jgi:hypothetical protein